MMLKELLDEYRKEINRFGCFKQNLIDIENKILKLGEENIIQQAMNGEYNQYYLEKIALKYNLNLVDTFLYFNYIYNSTIFCKGEFFLSKISIEKIKNLTEQEYKYLKENCLCARAYIQLYADNSNE